jgi:excisionase family DNA binding protein
MTRVPDFGGGWRMHMTAREETDPLAGRLAVPLAEAARLLGISARHARDLVAEGVIEVVELGSKRVVAVSELRRLVGEKGA